MKKQNDFVPEWAKKVVWYQIFPEHFRNGNKYNDPTVETLKGAGPNDYTSPWQVHPWTSDWYKLQPYETTKIIQALITPDGDGNPLDGIYDWRLDVAFCIKHKFWKEWRKHFKLINPQAYLIAEVIGSIKELKLYLQGDEFDAVMNYNFAFASSKFFINKKNKISVEESDKKLKQLRNSFTPGVAYVQQNLFDSHDTTRLASHIVNSELHAYSDWAKYFNLSKAENPD